MKILTPQTSRRWFYLILKIGEDFFAWLLPGFRKRPTPATPAKAVTRRIATPTDVEWDHDWTLRELLSELDTTFAWLKKRIRRCGNLRVLRAANNIGPYIIHDGASVFSRYEYGYMGFPSFFFLATKFPRHARVKKDGVVECSAVLAVRRESLPWQFEKIKGVPYDCSFCYEFDDDIHWFDLLIVINRKTGSLVFPRSFYRQNISVRGHGSYTRPVYGEQEQIKIIADDWCKGNIRRAKKSAAEWLAWCLNTYVMSETACQIIVKKKKSRVTFTIPQERVVAFFRKREKAEITPTGKRRTIFHLVRAHYRRTSKLSTVVNHARGARHFFWRGYECSIFAHGWHGKSLLHLQTGLYDQRTKDEKRKGIHAHIATHEMMKALEGRR